MTSQPRRRNNSSAIHNTQKLQIKVKPNARKNELTLQADGNWVASITASPVDGKANQSLIRLLADHFGVPQRAVTIESGVTSRIKRVRIEGLADPEHNP
jgi:hypothetical protein